MPLFSAAQRWSRKQLKIGRMDANVFPVPVGAMTRTFLPSRIGSMATRWMPLGSSNPIFSKCFRIVVCNRLNVFSAKINYHWSKARMSKAWRLPKMLVFRMPNRRRLGPQLRKPWMWSLFEWDPTAHQRSTVRRSLHPRKRPNLNTTHTYWVILALQRSVMLEYRESFSWIVRNWFNASATLCAIIW